MICFPSCCDGYFFGTPCEVFRIIVESYSDSHGMHIEVLMVACETVPCVGYTISSIPVFGNLSLIDLPIGKTFSGIHRISATFIRQDVPYSPAAGHSE
jgi:hypothetical protein